MWMLWYVRRFVVYCSRDQVTNNPQEYSDNRYLRRVQVMAHQVERRFRALLGCHRSFGSVLRVAEIVREEVRSESSRQGGEREGQAWEQRRKSRTR